MIADMPTYWVDLTGETGTTGSDVILYIDGTDSTWSSNLPYDEPPEKLEDPEAKAVVRERRREESLYACRHLRLQHERRPNALSGHVTSRAPRPTLRRTATCVKNFRR